MKPLRVSSAFKKDLKRAGRRGSALSKLETIISELRAGKPLPPSANAHPLKGAWKDHWDCHIEPDWLLIYRVTDEEVLLERTGITRTFQPPKQFTNENPRTGLRNFDFSDEQVKVQSLQGSSLL